MTNVKMLFRHLLCLFPLPSLLLFLIAPRPMFLPVLVSARITTVSSCLAAATLVQGGHLILLLRTLPAEVGVLLTFLALTHVNTSSTPICLLALVHVNTSSTLVCLL